MTKIYSKRYAIDSHIFSILTDDNDFFGFLDNYKKIFRVTSERKIHSSFYIFFNERTKSLKHIQGLYPHYRNVICSNKEYKFSDRYTFVWNMPYYGYFILSDTSKVPSRTFFYCTKRKNYEQFFYYIFEPTFFSLLNRCGLFLIHATAVAKNGAGILFPAETGCGKTTVAVSLILSGFKIVSDDLVFLRPDERHIWVISSFEKVSITKQTIGLFDRLKFLKEESPVKVGPFYKWIVNVDKLHPGAKIRKAPLKAIIFPQRKPCEETRIEPISRKEAYLKLLSQTNWDGHNNLDDSIALKKKFELYETLTDRLESFNIYLGEAIDKLPSIISHIL